MIIVVITALVLIDNNKFGGDVKLENFAYDVALSIRQTQVYGIAVKRFNNNFSTGYGMYFLGSDPNTYLLFADENGTGLYDPSKPSEIVQTNGIDQGYAISGLCVVAAAGTGVCVPATEIDILYVRPQPNAYISANVGAGAVSCVQNQRTACFYEAQIQLSSPKGDKRAVIVDATGQISVVNN